MAKIETLLTRKGAALLRTIVLMSVIVVGVVGVVSVGAQDGAANRVIAQQLSVAGSQYNQGLYESANQSLVALQKDYSAVMSEKQKSQADELGQKVAAAMQARAAVEMKLIAAIEASNNGQYRSALELYEQVGKDKYANDAQKDEALLRSKNLSSAIATQEDAMKTLFNESYALYQAGELEKAREGFLKVQASGVNPTRGLFRHNSTYYIAQIDKDIEAQKAAEQKAIEDARAAAEAKAQKQAQEQALQAQQQAQKEEQERLARQQEAKRIAQQKEQERIAAEKRNASNEQSVVVTHSVRESGATANASSSANTANTANAANTANTANNPAVNNPSNTQSSAQEPSQTNLSSQENSYLRVIQERDDRQKDYTKAIVSDSITKAEQALEQENFNDARGALSVAYANLEKTKMLLGDELYNNYKGQLDQIDAQIDNAEMKVSAQRAKDEREQMEQLQDKIRSNVEAQRQQAIKDYLANAMAFQREQRYEEALTQLNALLAIDPLNNLALLQKQTLEETILWREQLSIQRDKHRQEIETLLNADRASIPYSDEVTYPGNWKDIVEKRKTQQDNKFSPEDLAVYRALDQLVDLTSYYEDMTLGEAIEILANAMEPRVTIVVLWSDLDMNAFVDKNTPINLTVPAPVKAKVGLNLLLSSVAGGLAEIGYVVTDGIIRVATRESLPDRMVTRRYDVKDLLGQSATYSFEMDTTDFGSQGGGRSAGGGGGGQTSQRSQSTDQDDRQDSSTIREESLGRAASIIQLIQETIDPYSWYDAGGDSTITIYSNNVLVVRQTLDNHEKINDLLDDLRSSLGEQVAIEARFLTVSENFLEEIGLDLDVFVRPKSSNWNDFIFEQNHAEGSETTSTGVPGNLAGTLASTLSGGYVLDDLQVNFILNATQAHRDAKNLNAPKVTVLSGESAAIRVQKETAYVSDYQFEDTTQAGDNQPIRTIADPEIATIRDGVILNVAPTITADKKYVLLNIRSSYTQTEFEQYDIPPTGGSADPDRLYTIQLPVSQIADIRTRVTVPDGGTLLIGGQKLTGEMNTVQGVPVLSKLPLFGRLFENRGKAKDSSILLILVKPSVILQDEQERDAIAAMESRF